MSDTTMRAALEAELHELADRCTTAEQELAEVGRRLAELEARAERVLADARRRAA